MGPAFCPYTIKGPVHHGVTEHGVWVIPIGVPSSNFSALCQASHAGSETRVVSNGKTIHCPWPQRSISRNQTVGELPGLVVPALIKSCLINGPPAIAVEATLFLVGVERPVMFDGHPLQLILERACEFNVGTRLSHSRKISYGKRPS